MYTHGAPTGKRLRALAICRLEISLTKLPLVFTLGATRRKFIRGDHWPYLRRTYLRTHEGAALHWLSVRACRCAIPQNFAVFVFETVKLGKACSTVQKTLPDNTIRPLNMQEIRTHNTMALCSVNLHKNVLKCTSKTFHHISLPPVWW